jgi:hypothetical protein
MKISSSRLQVSSGFAISAILLLFVYVSGCSKPGVTTSYCDYDQETYVNANTGVDDETVVVCAKKKMTWLDHGETWEVEFKNDSPFEGKPKKVKKGDPPGVARSDVPKHKATAFPYTITVNGKKFDPQIIVMN